MAEARPYRSDLTEDLAIGVVALSLFAAAAIALTIVGVPVFKFSSYLSNAITYAAAWFICFLTHAAPSLVRARPESPIRHVLTVELGREYRRKILRSAPVLACLLVFMPTFSAVKSAIPLFTDYAWDHRLIALDRTMHGTDPWRILQPLIGYPIVTSAISMLYHLWILLIYAGGIYFAIYQRDRALRQRYFVCYFLCWSVIGMVMAVQFASVGPCFVGPILGDTTFAAQTAYLKAANTHWPVLTIEVQDTLVAWYRSGDHGLGRGISAMPSMHVSLAFLFFLAMRHVTPWAGRFFGAFFVIIFIGSVHLGYHYAVDGYVAAAVTLFLWWVTKPLLQLGARSELVPSR